MFKFLRRRKKGQAIGPVPEEFDITAQQLVQRFHSEGSLCDTRQRGILLDAAACTQQQIDLRLNKEQAHKAAVEQCNALSELQTNIVSLRESDSDLKHTALRVHTHIDVVRAPMEYLETEKVACYEERFESLISMTEKIEQATGCLEEELRTVAQRRARSRQSRARASRSRSFMSSVDRGISTEVSSVMPLENVEFLPVNENMDHEAIADAYREAESYIEQVTSGWAALDTDGLRSGIDGVRELLAEYEACTARRAAKLQQYMEATASRRYAQDAENIAVC
eukprot:jgi/Ulvmu1/356/UM001_0362.1